MIESRTSRNDETIMIKMYALQHFIKHGCCKESDEAISFKSSLSVSSATISGKLQFFSPEDLFYAWKALGNELNELNAKKQFLLLLVSIAPYWKWQQFL